MGPAEERWKRVLSGEFTGTFVTLPHDTRAERRPSDPRARHAHDTRRDTDHNHELREKP
jgi:hypothetical protein